MNGLKDGQLHGEIIKHIFNVASTLGELHQTVTSPRGNFFRLRVLQRSRNPLRLKKIQEMSKKEGLQETKRHLKKLLSFQLIELVGKNTYKRTELGEKLINAIKAFERRIGKKEAEKIYSAHLGMYSIELFLVVYGQKRSFSWLNELFGRRKKLEIKYNPARIGRMAHFLPRTAEAIAAIDKLDSAGILTYEDDGYVHLWPVKSRGFYQYLKSLYGIVVALSD